MPDFTKLKVKKNGKEYILNACTTIEELNTIEFKFTMHDFSKEEVVADE